MKGQLRDHPLVELVDEISAAGLSGVLRLARERVKAVVCFESGALVLASTNLRIHRLSSMLWHWGVVAPERLASMSLHAMTDGQTAAALVSSGAVAPEEVAALRARQSEEALRPLLLWTDGEWSFDPRTPPDAATHAPLEARQLLIEAARRLPSEFVSARLRDDKETVSPAANVAEGIQLQPEEGFILSRVDAPTSLGEVVAVSGLPEERTKCAVYALAACGLVRREGARRALPVEALSSAQAKRETTAKSASQAASPVADQKQPEAAPEETNPLADIESLLARARAQTHYEVLGVAMSAPTDDLKRAYYALARRFHPDRFRRDADAELLARIESAFTRVAQAYDVLKDAKTRATYDLKVERLAARAQASAAPPPEAPRADAASGAAEAKTQSAPAPPGATPPESNPFVRAEELFRQGLGALERGDYERASKCLSEAALLAPRQSRYRAFYGCALARDRRTRRHAEAELTAAISIDPDNAEYHVMLAELYRDIGLRNRALGELRHALSLDPGNAAARSLSQTLKGAG